MVVRSFKRVSDLFRDRQRLVHRNRPPHDLIRERWTFNEFHHKGAHALAVCKTMDVRDVRMVERRKQLCFATKAREAIGIVGEGGKQDLDRDIAVQCRIAGSIHFPHSTGANAG